MEKRTRERIGFGILLTVSSGILCLEAISSTKFFPNTSQVQEGYVIPSKLEIQVRDLDGNGQKETIVEYDGRSYLFRLDGRGNPVVQNYEIVPSQVIPSRIVPRK